MEGRAIARPNRRCAAGPTSSHPAFNGGPSNRSAKRRQRRVSHGLAAGPSMEGRAIARPNATDPQPAERVGVPSMEGRAIARPNSWRFSPLSRPISSLQWRAEQSLGQTISAKLFDVGVSSLQWRAEQSLGQTHRRDGIIKDHHAPSMEGRAIARPNNKSEADREARIALQWRAEQSLGQTARSPMS